jgi:hypothetical protein
VIGRNHEVRRLRSEAEVRERLLPTA